MSERSAVLNETHAPELTSWVESANRAGTDFPIQNLPHGVFRRGGSGERFRGGVAIGDFILDMQAVAALGIFDGIAADAAAQAGAPTLNGLMAMGSTAWSGLRLTLSRLLRASAPEAELLRPLLLPQSDAEYSVPCDIGDYTDFFTSYGHALNCGHLFHPQAPLPPNFRSLPIAYHGRASSIEISGTSFRRPLGQVCPPGHRAVFRASRMLDYEVELGAFIGPGNRRGESISMSDANNHVFGVCLLNDWSARDVQAWEAVPLGPFSAKNFLTTISPWIVTLEALAPFRCTPLRDDDGAEFLPYLSPPDVTALDGFDIELEVRLATTKSGTDAMRLSRSNYRHSYWTLAQMVTHHTQNGCNLRPGDLFGTGTQSGPTHGEEGCLLELTHGGRNTVTLSNGELRTFLEDGDTVTMYGWCERDGYARIGFGECRGTVLPASE